MDIKKAKWFTNREIKEKIIARSKITKLIREFFWSKDFIECETPILIPSPGMEPNLEPFVTKIKSQKNEKQAFLISSPEYCLKELLVGGLKNIFQITKSFRNNEDQSRLHNPEFTILEWYRAESDYKEIMEDVQDLFLYVCQKLFHKDYVVYNGIKISFKKPWEKKTVNELFNQYCQIDLDKIDGLKDLKQAAINKGYSVDVSDTWETVFWHLFLNEIEPNLPKDKPIIVYEYPKELASLSKVCKDKPKYCERFEFYIAGMELGNAFSELTDALEQEQRFIHEQELKKKWGKTVYPFDKDFINALKIGMPHSGGIALGVDRMAMVFLDAKSLDEVMWFPFED